MIKVSSGGAGGQGQYRGATPPDNTEVVWLFMGNASNTYGKSNKPLIKGALYYNAGEDPQKDWEPVTAIWS